MQGPASGDRGLNGQLLRPVFSSVLLELSQISRLSSCDNALRYIRARRHSCHLAGDAISADNVILGVAKPNERRHCVEKRLALFGALP